MASPLIVEKCKCGGKFKYDSENDMVECMSCHRGMALYCYLLWINGDQEKAPYR